MEEKSSRESVPLDISEQDVVEAMKAIQGYLDITPGDFRQVYQAAYTLAIERLFNTLTAADLMTSPVLQVDQDMNLIEAAGLLADKQVSGAPVVDGSGKIVGIVSEKDFLREMGVGGKPSFMQMVSHCLHNNESCMIGRLHSRTVGEIMTKPPITGSVEMTISAISALFVARKINRLPVIDKSGMAVGIVTRTDLAHTYSIFEEEG